MYSFGEGNGRRRAPEKKRFAADLHAEARVDAAGRGQVLLEPLLEQPGRINVLGEDVLEVRQVQIEEAA